MAALVILASASLAPNASTSAAATTTSHYTLSTATVTNPKRGFMRRHSNARNWSPQTTRTISRHGLQISKTMPAGTYDMFRRLPDPSPQLADRADYAIQLSNTGTWDASSRMNRLTRTVTVS